MNGMRTRSETRSTLGKFVIWQRREKGEEGRKKKVGWKDEIMILAYANWGRRERKEEGRKEFL